MSTEQAQPESASVATTGHGQTRSRRWRRARWIALAVVALTIGAGAAFGSQLGQDPTLVDSPLIGEPAPADTRLPHLEGEGALSLGDLRGDILVVNFWASWCLTCQEEHPDLLAAADDYADQDVTLIGVSYQDQRDTAIGYLDEHGRGDPAAYQYVTDPGSDIALDFGVFGVPETFFIDREGTIVAKITGVATYQLLSNTLDEILAGGEPESHEQGPVTRAPGG